MKPLIIQYSKSTKDEKHLILKKHPELVPVLKQIVEQKRMNQPGSQMAPPVVKQQPIQNTPIIQQFPKIQACLPQTFPQFLLKQTFQPPVQAIPKPQIKNPQTPPQTLPQTFIQKPNSDLKLEKNTSPLQKKQKIENKNPLNPKEEEMDIDSLNDVTKIAGVNLEKESSWFDEDVFGECLIDALKFVINHKVKHTPKANVSNKKRKLYETTESVKLIENEDKMEKKKPAKKLKMKDEDDEEKKLFEYWKSHKFLKTDCNVLVASALTSINDFEVLNSKEIELFEEMLTFGGRAKLRTLLKK
jgi:hypothetical protein